MSGSPTVIRVGTPGPAGPIGPAPRSITTADFVQPSAGDDVTASVNTTAWMAPGQSVFVTGGGYYTVASIASVTSVILTNEGLPDNAAPGAEVAEGAYIVFGALAERLTPIPWDQTPVSGSAVLPDGAIAVSFLSGTGPWPATYTDGNGFSQTFYEGDGAILWDDATGQVLRVPKEEDAYIPALSVTVGTCGDYETWDEMYRAVSVMRGGLLSVLVGGSHTLTDAVYDFSMWAQSSISASSVIFTPTQDNLIFSSSTLCDISGTVEFDITHAGMWPAFKGVNLDLTATTSGDYAGYVGYYCYKCVGNITADIQVYAFGRLHFPRDNYLNVTTPYLTVGDGAHISNAHVWGIYAFSGSAFVDSAYNTSLEPISSFIVLYDGATLKNYSADVGTNGCTTVFSLIGGTLFAGFATGTYTELYNQPPGIPTQYGMIYAEFDKAQVSAATTGTVAIEAGKKSLDLTGALAATLTLDGSAILDGDTVTVYSTNGVTALTLVKSGGAVRGFMPGIGAGGIINIQRAGANLNVW